MNIRSIKQEIEKLTYKELGEFALWFDRLLTKKERERLSDDSRGIDPADLLNRFRKAGGVIFTDAPGSRHNVSMGATVMWSFYEKTRVRGCRLEQDEDMILVEWGPESGNADDYSVSFTRQIVKPAVRGDRQMWALYVSFKFSPIPDRFEAVQPGNKWFRSLEECAEWDRFIYKSKLFRQLDSVPANRVLTSYTRID